MARYWNKIRNVRQKIKKKWACLIIKKNKILNKKIKRVNSSINCFKLKKYKEKKLELTGIKRLRNLIFEENDWNGKIRKNKKWQIVLTKKVINRKRKARIVINLKENTKRRTQISKSSEINKKNWTRKYKYIK